MTEDQRKGRGDLPKGANHMPADSTFYDKIIPILLVGLAAFTLVLILVAIAVLLGIIPVS